MTGRQVVFAVAKFWGLLPHVLNRYPFRYYKELRDSYFASFQTAAPDDDESTTIDINAEEFAADSL